MLTIKYYENIVCNIYMGGGILPVTIHKNTILLLFSREALHQKPDPGKWSDFGGSTEKKETPLQTAIREGWEESAGFLGTKRQIKHLIQAHLVQKISTGFYTTYLIHIPYKKNLPRRFAKHFQKMKKSHPEQVYARNGLFEKDKLRWMRLCDLQRNMHLFRPWYRMIVRKIITALT